jgi:HSP20 family molecular chaperone IbpA
MIKELSERKNVNKFDHINSIRFSLCAIARSINGWQNWIHDPQIMSVFSKEELEEIEKILSDFTKYFIEYDIKMTEKGSRYIRNFTGLESPRRYDNNRNEGLMTQRKRSEIDKRKPLIDIFENDKHVTIISDITSNGNIVLYPSDKSLTIEAPMDGTHYHEEIEFPFSVDLGGRRIIKKNGILEVTLNKL